ncbi:hypothetical protein AB0J35_43805 [Nonomuraea angiospora]|uniref:hypothetical protein n=1 Tax=Nonomuraea angiospora TaxID=46172 RepID=UPI003425AB18
MLRPQTNPHPITWPLAGAKAIGIWNGRSTRTRPFFTRKVGAHKVASGGTVGGKAIGSACQAQSLREVGEAIRGSFTRRRAPWSLVRSRVTSCRSAAASTICRATFGGSSSSVRSAGNTPPCASR